jgi:hypothetical protein
MKLINHIIAYVENPRLDNVRQLVGLLYAPYLEMGIRYHSIIILFFMIKNGEPLQLP